MLRRSGRRGAVVAALVVAVLGAAAGISYAQATGDVGVVNACAKTTNGQLRVDTGEGCGPSETGLTLSRGGSTAAETYTFRIGNGIPITSTDGHNKTHVLSFHLAPGSYVITTETVAVNDFGHGIVVCTTGNRQVGVSFAQGAIGSDAGFARQQTLTAQSVFPLPDGADLEVSCYSVPNATTPPEGGSPSIEFADVVATKVDAVTSSEGS